MKIIDKTGDNELKANMADWLKAKKALADFTKIEKYLRTELINVINKDEGDILKCGEYELKRTFVKPSDDVPDRVITHEDIGQIIEGKKGRKGYYKITINEVQND